MKDTWGYLVYRKNITTKWTRLNQLTFRKVYYGLTGEGYVLEQWVYNNHLDCYVYYTGDENFDSYKSFVDTIVSPPTA
jgi:hypothetical protein